MITAKHLARDLDVEVRVVRAMLRARYGLSPIRCWAWDENEAVEIRKWLAKSLNKEVRGKEVNGGGA